MNDSQFCPDCGAANAADAGFCEGCGARLDAAASVPSTAPAPAASVAPTAPKQGRKAFFVLGAVLVLGTGAALAFPEQFRQLKASLTGGLSKDTTAAQAGALDSAVFQIPDPHAPGTSTTRPIPPPPVLGGTRQEMGQGVGTIAAGTVLRLRAVERVCAGQNQQGDQFTALLERRITGSNGAVLPKATEVTFSLASANAADLRIEAETIDIGETTYRLSASVNSLDITKGGLPPLPPGIPPGAVVMRPGGSGGESCIEPNALIQITLRRELLLEP